MATRWMVAGCFAFALASPVRAVDSLDAIRADLANCKGPPSCLHRTLLQARLNYRLKMIQVARADAISADALNSVRVFRSLSLVPVMSGGRMIVPRCVMVYLKVRALGPGAQPNSLRLALAVDYAEFNGTRVPLASNEVERV